MKRLATSDVQILTDDEIKDVKPTETHLRFWHLTKKGDNYTKAAKITTGKESFYNYYKLSNSSPAPTLPSVVAIPGHWEYCRLLTYREWKRLSSFPDDYQAKTDKIGKYMIGMSVPPKMMQKVAEAVISQWF